MTPQLGLAHEPRGELANPKAALRIPSRSQGFGLSHTYRKCCAHRCSRKLSTGGRLAARMPKNESKTDQRDTQTSTGCSDVRGRTRQSPAMQLSRPPVGWESSPSSAMSPQNRKGNHATTASRRQPRRSLSADEGASIPLHEFRPLSSPACPPTAPRMGQPPQKERCPPAILSGGPTQHAECRRWTLQW